MAKTFRCAVCHEPISYITWHYDHTSERTGAWIHERRRGWVHDWNGSLDSPTPQHHLAQR